MAVSFNYYCHGLYGNPLFFILSCFENTDAVFINNYLFISLACLKEKKTGIACYSSIMQDKGN